MEKGNIALVSLCDCVHVIVCRLTLCTIGHEHTLQRLVILSSVVSVGNHDWCYCDSDSEETMYSFSEKV